jgi:FkbM family methyltransferase
MRDVGTFLDRNQAFSRNFSREVIITQCVEKKSCAVIFDVGSHHGESLEFFVEISPNARIYCFEPDPDSYDVLRKNYPEHLHTFNIAVSDQVGVVNFYRNPISHTNSLYKVNLKSNDSIKISEERVADTSDFSDVVNQKIVVPCTTLKTFVRENDVDFIDLLKIDVQGAEKEVLKGAEDILHMVEAVIVEVALFDFYESSNNFLDLENILIPAGFGLYSILDISQNPMNGRTDWVEVLYKKVKK